MHRYPFTAYAVTVPLMIPYLTQFISDLKVNDSMPVQSLLNLHSAESQV